MQNILSTHLSWVHLSGMYVSNEWIYSYPYQWGILELAPCFEAMLQLLFFFFQDLILLAQEQLLPSSDQSKIFKLKT